MIRIGILAVQGAFIEHEKILNELGAETVELRKKDDLAERFDALVLPGGESTVQGKLLDELDMMKELRERIISGMPVMGTCAGIILLAENISNDKNKYFGTLPIEVTRNAFGRQIDSFYTVGEYKGIGTVPMTFIRAPKISGVYSDTEILAELNGEPVAVRYKNQLAMTFHPELSDNYEIHRSFIDMISV